MKGFPTNTQIKSFVIRYHRSLEASPKLNPPYAYKEHVRSIIPPKVQMLLDETCHIFESDFQMVDTKCQPAISEDEAYKIVLELTSQPGKHSHLTFWMSTIKTLKSMVKPQLKEAIEIIKAIEPEV